MPRAQSRAPVPPQSPGSPGDFLSGVSIAPRARPEACRVCASPYRQCVCRTLRRDRVCSLLLSHWWCTAFRKDPSQRGASTAGIPASCVFYFIQMGTSRPEGSLPGGLLGTRDRACPLQSLMQPILQVGVLMVLGVTSGLWSGQGHLGVV